MASCQDDLCQKAKSLKKNRKSREKSHSVKKSRKTTVYRQTLLLVSGVMSFRLRNYKLPKLSGITVKSATFLFAVFDFNLLFVTRQEFSVTISELESLHYFRLKSAAYSTFTGQLDVGIVRVTFYVNVSSTTISNRNVVCFRETPLIFH